jgi:exodeoxyribonuclease X
MTLLFVVLDVETTGMDPAIDQVVELGYVGTDLECTRFRDSYLVKPTVPISPGASACHHLIDSDLEDAGPLPCALASLACETAGCDDAIAYAAHNAPFDKSFLPTLTDKPWLDTLRMAKRYLPELPHHTNSFLRYALKLDVPRDIVPHRALGDCIVTAALLRWLLAGPARADFERMGTKEFELFIDGPLLLTMCNFGKHAGKRWTEVPRDYLAWMLRTGGFDPDTTFTAETLLRNPRPDPQI